MIIAKIQEAPEGVTVIRNDKQLTLQENEGLQWGDKVINSGSKQITFFVPNDGIKQASSIITMDPGAESVLVREAAPLTDGSSRTKVVALTDGVELFVVDSETEVMGLVGATAGGLGGAATATTAGLLGLFALDQDDPDTPPPPPPVLALPPSGVSGASTELAAYLEDQPLSSITNMILNPLAQGTNAAGETLADSGDDVITDTLAGALGIEDKKYDPKANDGVPGAIDSLDKGILLGTDGGSLEPVGGLTSGIFRPLVQFTADTPLENLSDSGGASSSAAPDASPSPLPGTGALPLPGAVSLPLSSGALPLDMLANLLPIPGNPL